MGYFMPRMLSWVVAIACLLVVPMARAQAPAAALPPEDGYRLWLRYVPVTGQWLARYRADATELVGADTSPTLRVAHAELARGLAGLLRARQQAANGVTRDGAIVFGTPRSCALVKALPLDLRQVGAEGYLIRTVTIDGHRVTVIAANTDTGVLYGVFGFLRLLQTRAPIDHLDIATSPKIGRRVLDHWDNLNGTVERGYAGDSLWQWQSLPQYLAPRYTDYARACASLGINGTVLDNVNASPFILTPLYLRKVAALAGVLRPYGIRVYLAVPFSEPVTLGGLKSADPADPRVRAWWSTKVAAIYRDIPDFGGFLVKANSEGQPGPEDYGRTQAQGADLLAQVLAPHGGIVMWRAFVYSTGLHPLHAEDRAKQAYDTFKPLDGKFADNVLVQVKNGPIDFQPREPFHPLFGAMPRTNLMLELQITKEYLGQRTSMVYLGPLFEEVLHADTWARGAGSTVARVIDGSLYGERLTAIAGVANTGSERNWTGSIFNQANWYAFGRLAWDPDLSARADRRGVGRHDLHRRPSLRRAGGAADAAIARGGGRLHDAARPRQPDGRRHSLRPRPLGGARAGHAARLEQRLLQPRRCGPASASIARRAGAMPSRSMHRTSPRSWATPRPVPMTSSSGSITFPGTTACAPGARCGIPWCCTTTGALRGSDRRAPPGALSRHTSTGNAFV